MDKKFLRRIENDFAITRSNLIWARNKNSQLDRQFRWRDVKIGQECDLANFLSLQKVFVGIQYRITYMV